VGGRPLAPQDAFVAMASGTSGAQRWAELNIVLTSYANACGYITASGAKRNGQTVQVYVIRRSNRQNPAFTAGSVLDAQGSVGELVQDDIEPVLESALDPSCMRERSSSRGSWSGTVTLTTVTPSRVGATLALTGPNGDRITGNIDAPVCSVPPGEGEPVGLEGGSRELRTRCCLP